MLSNVRYMISAAFAFLAACAFADVWYVDASNYGKSGDGRSPGASAFGTIQEAVAAANEGDTVMVAPGVYDQGETVDSFAIPMKNRVYIDKPITLCGADKDTTIIKGKLASIAEDSFG